MHKWNLRFAVASDPLTLIAELEQKISIYGTNQEEVPTATVQIGGRWVDAAVDTAKSRSFASEGYACMVARPEEM